MFNPGLIICPGLLALSPRTLFDVTCCSVNANVNRFSFKALVLFFIRVREGCHIC